MLNKTIYYASNVRNGSISTETAVSEISNIIVSQARSGGIVLLHDLYEVSAKGFIKAYDILKEQGYKFVTVSELLNIHGKDANGYTFYGSYWAEYHGVRCGK